MRQRPFKQVDVFTATRCRGNPLAVALDASGMPEQTTQHFAQWTHLSVKASQVIAAQSLDNGPVWIALLLDSPQTVLKLSPDHLAPKNLGVKVGVAALCQTSGEAAEAPLLEVRAFAAASGIPEDPVTGSLNASLGQWLVAEGRLPTRYLEAQGAGLNRAGRVHIEQDRAGQLWVGGESLTCISGTVSL